MLSNGVLLDHISPLGPGCYSPDVISSPPTSPRNGTGFGGNSPRNTDAPWKSTLASPGPGAYKTPEKTPPKIAMSKAVRTVCLPVVKDASPREKPTPKPSPTKHVARASASLSKMKGASISNSPRHFNLHNPNSALPRERDPDFDNPPPGSYSARYPGSRAPTVGRMSATPRSLAMTPRSEVPGPGSYNPTGGTIGRSEQF